MQKHGGRRTGAGRRPKAQILVKKRLAERILSDVDEIRLWQELLETEDEKVRLSALIYLCNRKHGLPPQSVAVQDVTEPSRRILPGEYISAVKTALGFSGQLKPLVTIEDESGQTFHGLPQD